MKNRQRLQKHFTSGTRQFFDPN